MDLTPPFLGSFFLTPIEMKHRFQEGGTVIAYRIVRIVCICVSAVGVCVCMQNRTLKTGDVARFSLLWKRPYTFSRKKVSY